MAGSAWPSSQVLNWIVDPTTRRRSHCFAVDTVFAPVTERTVVTVPFTTLRTVTVPEFDDSDNRQQWRFRASRAQGTIDDEISVAFA